MELFANTLSVLSSLLAVLAFFGFARYADVHHVLKTSSKQQIDSDHLFFLKFVVVCFAANLFHNYLNSVVSAVAHGSSALPAWSFILNAASNTLIIYIGWSLRDFSRAALYGAVLGVLLFIIGHLFFSQNNDMREFGQQFLIVKEVKDFTTFAINGSMNCLIGASMSLTLGAMIGFAGVFIQGVAFILSVMFLSLYHDLSLTLSYFMTSIAFYPIAAGIYGGIVGGFLQSVRR